MNIIKAQTEFVEGYVKLLDFEYYEIVNDSTKHLPDGKYYTIQYDNEGKILSLETISYKKGKKSGESLRFSQGLGSFFLSQNIGFKNGLMDGYYMNTDNHTFSKEGYYEKGKKNGIWKENESSEFKIVSYKNGIKSGSFKSTDNDLNIEVSGQYKKGKKNGIWITKYTDTDMIIKEEYKNGELISEK
ncbi:hypothetical protein [Aquimarina aquimarini]|uniref:hypothetical protein n=1 Tax=Aquimarina aquimarini TaxID=1191734 RepID=UPI001F3CABE8|nr:hypothetical protein [Aquimarina aquimarini]